MQGRWDAFARTGVPGDGWPRYTSDARPVLVFDRASRVDNDPPTPTAGKHGKVFKSSDADERFPPAATHAFTAFGTDCFWEPRVKRWQGAPPACQSQKAEEGHILAEDLTYECNPPVLRPWDPISSIARTECGRRGGEPNIYGAGHAGRVAPPDATRSLTNWSSRHSAG